MRQVTSFCSWRSRPSRHAGEPSRLRRPHGAAGRRSNRSNAPAVGVYVTNEQSGDLSIIDAGTQSLVATVPLGKRPRGIAVSPDRTMLYVALSGSPAAGPGVDEKTLPPPDRTADGIGVVDVRQQKLIKVLPSGTDPEQVAVSQDGTRLFVANEDAAMASVIDLATGTIVETFKIGEEPEGVRCSRRRTVCGSRRKRTARCLSSTWRRTRC